MRNENGKWKIMEAKMDGVGMTKRRRAAHSKGYFLVS